MGPCGHGSLFSPSGTALGAAGSGGEIAADDGADAREAEDEAPTSPSILISGGDDFNFIAGGAFAMGTAVGETRPREWDPLWMQGTLRDKKYRRSHG